MLRCILNATSNPSFTGILRCVSTSAVRGRNIKNIEWDDVGDTQFKEKRKELALTDPVFAYQDYGVRKPGIVKKDGSVEVIPEMVPELMVPDLTGFKLKPYVSFRVPDVKREELTAQALFNAVYREKIIEDFKNNDLLEDGKPKNPTSQEQLTADDALLYARRTGSDIFAEDPEEPDPVEIKFWKRR